MGRRGRPSNRMLAATQSHYCAYPHRICLQQKVEGQRFCLHHILEDRRAPFRHCSFVHSGRRCPNAANKVERGETPLCALHKGPPRPIEQEDEPTVSQLMTRNSDSDTESIDQDIFRHAYIYTEEEASRILRDKLIKLRALYIEQFQHLKYMLKEKRLQFIQARRKEMTEAGTSNSMKITDKKEYLKLRAMLKYNKLYGHSALLDRKARKQDPQNPPQVCIFHGCTNTALPLAPYCRQHILFDHSQVLFRPCAGGNPPCLTPIISYTRRNTCLLHSKFAPDQKETVTVASTTSGIKVDPASPIDTNVINNLDIEPVLSQQTLETLIKEPIDQDSICIPSDDMSSPSLCLEPTPEEVKSPAHDNVQHVN